MSSPESSMDARESLHNRSLERLQLGITSDDDSDESYFPPFQPPRSHEGSTGSAILEALPLLRRPSIYLDRAKSSVSLGTGRGRSYGSDDGGQHDDGEALVRVQSGVKKVEAITMLWTRKSLVIAYISIFLIATITSLDSNTTQVLVPYATSSFNTHSLLSVIGIVSGVMIAVVKAPMAKIGDVFGRMEAFLLSVLLYVAGYIQMAVSSNVETYASAVIFYAAGLTGLQIMQQIVIADTSTLLNRALFSSIPDTPYLWNVWLGPTLGQAYLDHLSWRWGYATFAVLLPICAIPLLATLWWNVRKAEKRGLVEEKKWRSMTWSDLVHHLFVELDFPGTLLLTAGFTLLLLPLALAASRPDTWRSSAILVMLGVGGVCLVCFILWDIKFAKFPIVTFRLMKNRTVACGCLAGFWYFMAYFIFGQYFQSYLQVARFNSAASAGRISETFSFSATVSNLLVGLAIKYTYRYRIYSLIGVPTYIVGLLLTTFFRGPSNPLSYVLISQIVTGVGGGMFHVPVQLGIQAVARHQEVGIATAMFLTFTSLGGSVGSAIAGAIWTGFLPERLSEYLPDMSPDERKRIYNDFKFAMSFARGSLERDGIVAAYVDVMKILTMTATLTALPMIYFVFAMREVKLDRPGQGVSLEVNVGSGEEEDEEVLPRASLPRRMSVSTRRSRPRGSDRQGSWWMMGSWGSKHRQSSEESM